MKGVELPINVLVLVVLGLVILLGILALFYGVWTGGASGVSLESAKNSACQLLVSTGCNDNIQTIYTNNFDADKDGTIDTDIGPGIGECNDPTDFSEDNLRMLCKCWYNIPELNIIEECKNIICNCD
jgi:hypothetical protein